MNDNDDTFKDNKEELTNAFKHSFIITNFKK